MQPSTSLPPQASQLTGHNSLRGTPPHKKSQPNAATAAAQPPTGAVATSSSTHSSSPEPILKKIGFITSPKISLIINS